MMTAQDPGLRKCGVWTVHSEFEGRPMLRAFCKTKLEADAMIAQLNREEMGADHWLVELTQNELEDFKNAGMLPPEF